jgi:hypothetical protein
MQTPLKLENNTCYILDNQFGVQAFCYYYVSKIGEPFNLYEGSATVCE